MTFPFQILNARSMTIDDLLRVDTGRQQQRETVRQAILDSTHNVFLYGTRGSGKTFFQKMQAHYFKQLDGTLLPIFLPCDIQFRMNQVSPGGFALHVLNTIFLEWWQTSYGRPKSDLLRLTAMDSHSIFDDLHPAQQRFVQLYKILHASQFKVEAREASMYRASAIAKAENRREGNQVITREGLLPSETSAILDELADLISQSDIRRIVIHLDEIELLDSKQSEDILTVCLELFNPVGVQFVASGTPTSKRDGDFFLSSVETAIELEGLSTASDLGEMISKYAHGSEHSFEGESIAVLYEFFGGHPRTSLLCCEEAVKNGQQPGIAVSPRKMTSACLAVQKRLAAWNSRADG